MGELNDLDITGQVGKKGYQTLGKAHEHVAAGILMRLGFDYMSLDYQGKSYDGVLVAYNKNPKEYEDAKEVFLRTQIKTARNSVPLKGGIRAGVDREYKSGVKEYKYTIKHADLIIGVDSKSLNLYLLPIIYTEKFGGSIALSKLEPLKNRWDLLYNWRKDYLEKVGEEL